jgi:hypothetical protein
MMKGATVLHVQNSRPFYIQVAISKKTLSFFHVSCVYSYTQINSCAGAYGNQEEAYCTVSIHGILCSCCLED